MNMASFRTRIIFQAILIVIQVILLIVLLFIKYLLPNPNSFTCRSGSISINGSSALYPLVYNAAQAYQSKCPGALLQVSKSSSNQGLQCLEAGKISVGDADTFLPKINSNLIDHTVAVVVFALIINNSVTNVNNLTTPEIKNIYSGAITNWNQIPGGPNMPAVPIGRIAGSGTRDTFDQYVLGANEKVKETTLFTDDEVENAVQMNAGTIGYVDLYTAKQHSQDVTILSIDGVKPTELAPVKENTYHFWNFEHMYTVGNSPTDGLINSFLQFMLSSDVDTIRNSLDYLNFNEMLTEATAEHNHLVYVPPLQKPSCSLS